MPKRSSINKTKAAPKRPGTSRDHDFATVARRVVEQAIGEKLTGEPLDRPEAGKNPHAVALGKLGGPKGGNGASKGAESHEKTRDRTKGRQGQME